MSKRKNWKSCENCDDCQYVGEGDFACMESMPPFLVKEEWIPTDRYNQCPNRTSA